MWRRNIYLYFIYNSGRYRYSLFFLIGWFIFGVSDGGGEYFYFYLGEGFYKVFIM